MNTTTELDRELAILVENMEHLSDEQRGAIASRLESAARQFRETYSSRRYIIRCAGCRLLAEVSRKDASTCTPACRVKAHRNGIAKRLRENARMWGVDGDVTPASLARAEAARVLAPELRSTFDEPAAQVEIVRRFERLVIQQAEAMPD